MREAMALRNERFSLARALRHPGEVFECFIVPFVHRISIVADELGDAHNVPGAPIPRASARAITICGWESRIISSC